MNPRHVFIVMTFGLPLLFGMTWNKVYESEILNEAYVSFTAVPIPGAAKTKKYLKVYQKILKFCMMDSPVGDHLFMKGEWDEELETYIETATVEQMYERHFSRSMFGSRRYHFFIENRYIKKVEKIIRKSGLFVLEFDMDFGDDYRRHLVRKARENFWKSLERSFGDSAIECFTCSDGGDVDLDDGQCWDCMGQAFTYPSDDLVVDLFSGRFVKSTPLSDEQMALLKENALNLGKQKVVDTGDGAVIVGVAEPEDFAASVARSLGERDVG